MKRGTSGLCGVLAIDKPAGITSHDVVDRVRRITGERRVGHAGTLDPMATGLMLVGVGAATRLSNYLTGHDKAYSARIVFGVATDTDDAEGRIVTQFSSSAPGEGLTVLGGLDPQQTLSSLVGKAKQLPPAYSAIKKNGVTAYKAAREGKARRLLAGRAHAITGRVVHGRGEGTGFGIATANLDLSATMVVQPKDGVYGGYAIVDGAPYATAINMGVAKSFEGASSPLEAHLLDFGGDLYGKSITIVFVEWLRESRVFDDQDELIRTIQGDIAWVRENLGEGAHGAH